MARHLLSEARVQAVIGRLVELFLQVGSVRAVHRLLEDALDRAPGEHGRLYPNRVYALLSADPTRAVNTASLEALEVAVDSVEVPEGSGETDRIRTEVLRTAAEYPVLADVVNETNLPPAVVQVLLEDLEPATVSPNQRFHRSARGPDWSFQDDAFAACNRSLDLGPNRKVGLVVPTGGGKTRIAMRIALARLAKAERPDTRVLWVTHRTRLRRQAVRELQRALNAGTPDLPEDAAALLDGRVSFLMVGDLPQALAEHADHIELVVVDEAHHAAAPSYAPLFEAGPIRGLFLTATPNRADGLPIGVDEIAYITTYRELFRRGVIVEPAFDAPITTPRWDRPGSVENLADYLLDRADNDLRKTLVVVHRTESAEVLHEAIVALLDSRPAHVLSHEDVVFVHGSRSSLGTAPDSALDEFAALPRGILIATGSLVGEGFDDPSIDGVVVTYPSTSISHLMQVAGRAIRWAPGKDTAHVIQARDSELAYHFEQRWLYQDISDRLRPQIRDVSYASPADLRDRVAQILQDHHVQDATVERVLQGLDGLGTGERVHVLLTGRPYYGPAERFDEEARWGALLVRESDRPSFVDLFNRFSDLGDLVRDDHAFLRAFLDVDPRRGSPWKESIDLLGAMRYARAETSGRPYDGERHRGYEAHPYRGTTWLKYLSFAYAPALPESLEAFLADALNKTAVAAEYMGRPAIWSLAVKLPLPLGGTWAYLLDGDQAGWVVGQCADLADLLRTTDPGDAFGTVDLWRHRLGSIPVPYALAHRLEAFISDDAEHPLTLQIDGLFTVGDAFANREEQPSSPAAKA